MEIYIKDIIKLCDGKLLSGDENIVINNIKIDSRKINDGDIYVGIRGEVNDGNIFFEDAINRGAKAIIVDNSKLEQYNILLNNGSYPDLKIIDLNSKVIKKEEILKLEEEFLVKPLLGKYKVYIIFNCENCLRKSSFKRSNESSEKT